MKLLNALLPVLLSVGGLALVTYLIYLLVRP